MQKCIDGCLECRYSKLGIIMPIAIATLLQGIMPIDYLFLTPYETKLVKGIDPCMFLRPLCSQ